MSEKNLTRISLEEARSRRGQTDISHLKELGDYEGPEEFETDWSRARVVIPEPKKAISLRVDPDVLEFFKAQGKGYQTRMNAVLRSYMEAKLKG